MTHILDKSTRAWDRRRVSVVIAVLVVANLLTLLPSGMYGHLIGSTVLFCLLPGSLLISWAFASVSLAKRQVSWAEIALLGSAASYLITTMVTLILHYAFGAVYYLVLLGTLDVIVLILLYLNLRAQAPFPASFQQTMCSTTLVAIVGIILLAAFLRLGNLGYSEYVGDEAEVVYRARQVILGNQEELFLQRKGPPQIMMTAAFALGTNSFNELALRFPFAWASLLSVLAVYFLGRSVWNERIGLIAAAILAIDGIVIGFSRLVQYQGIVLLTLVMIAYCLHRMSVEANSPNSSSASGPNLSTRYLSLSCILIALALLTHYETALIVPSVVMITYPQLAQRHDPRSPFSRANLKELILSVTVALALLLIFYVPFILHPHFGSTVDTYGYRRIGIGQGGPFNNIDRYAASSIFYNSVYLVAVTAILWVVGTVNILAANVPRRKIIAYLSVTILAAGIVISMLAPASLTIGGRSLAFLFFLPVLAVAIMGLQASVGKRAILVWFWISFVAYAFFIRVPGLHYYTMAPAAALVAAVGLDGIFGRLAMYTQASHVNTRYWLKWGLVSLVWVFLAGYLYLVFVKSDPPYAVDFPEHRTALYWTPQNEFPEGGFFGFPRHSGWKALAALYHQGDLRGTYMSNKKQIKPEWTYMRSPVQEEQDPHYFFYDTLSKRMTQNETYPLEWAEENFELVGYVRVNGNERIHIFERIGEVNHKDISYYDAEPYEAMYEHIDWLSEYRRAYQHGLSDDSLSQLGEYLETQATLPQSLLIFNDALIEEALNYYYGGDATKMTIPSAWDETRGLPPDLSDGMARVFLVNWVAINEQPTSSWLQWLEENYQQVASNDFGSLVVTAFEPKK